MAYIEAPAEEFYSLPYIRGYGNNALSSRIMHVNQLRFTAASVYIVGGPFDHKRFGRDRVSPTYFRSQDDNLRYCDECGCVARTSPGFCTRLPEVRAPEEGVEQEISTSCSTCGHAFCRHCYMPTRREELCRACQNGYHDDDSWTPQGRELRSARVQLLGRRAFPVIPRWTRDGYSLVESFPFVYEPSTISLAGGPFGEEADITEAAQARLRREGLWLHVVASRGTRTVYITIDQEGTGDFDHYHHGCWGNVRWDASDSPAQIAQRAHDILTHINARSPAHNHPAGLPYSVNEIPHGDPRREAVWSRERSELMTRQERFLADVLSRQEGVGLNVPESVLVVGCGGVGWNFAMQAALVGVRKIVVADADLIEASNLTRIPLPAAAQGSSKANMLASTINSGTWRHGVDGQGYGVYVYPHMISPSHILNQAPLRQTLVTPPGQPLTCDVLVDTTDNIASQRYLHNIARQLRARYIRAGYDGGWHVTVSSRIAPTWEVEGTGEGYRVPAWIGGAQFVASMAMTKMCVNPRLEISCDMRDMLSRFHQQDLEVGEEERAGTIQTELLDPPVIRVPVAHELSATPAEAADVIGTWVVEINGRRLEATLNGG